VSPARSKKQAGRCLVAGYDASEGSRAAISWALQQQLPDGRLVLVLAERALRAPASPLSSSKERARFGHAIFDELLLDGDAALADLDLVTEVRDADPATALIEAAEHHEADEIVVGRKAHSRLHRALGGLTEELLKRSPVPVVSVPQDFSARSSAAAGPPGRARSRAAKSGSQASPAARSARRA